MKKSQLLGMIISLIVISFNTNASIIGITGYDIQNASDSDLSGIGWSHVYTGTITPTTAGTLVNYTGGTGTLADGVYSGTTSENTELFCEPYRSVRDCDATDNNNTNQIVTLFLDGFYKISKIEIYGGDHGAVDNSIPGAIDGMLVTINSSTQTFSTIGFGAMNAKTPNLINDLVTITGSSLDSLITNQIVLSNITIDEYGTGPTSRFSIAEIMIYGDVNAVPIPASLWLFGSGLLGLVGIARCKKAA